MTKKKKNNESKVYEKKWLPSLIEHIIFQIWKNLMKLHFL